MGRPNTINNSHKVIFAAFSIILLCTCPVFGLEELSEGEMDIITGQAGITIILTSVLIENNSDEFRIYDTVGGDILFDDISLSLELSTNAPSAASSITQGITLDIVEEFGNPIMQLNMPDMGTDFNFATSDIVFNDKSLGSIDINEIKMPDFEMGIYAYNGSGIDSGIGFKFDIDKFEYTYDTETTIDPESSIIMTGIMIGSRFTGPPLPSYSDTVSPGNPINTDSWQLTDGLFELGSTDPVWSFSIDLEKDSSPYLEHKFNIDSNGNYNLDSDGYIGTAVGGSEPYIANPRQNDAYIDANIRRVRGSIRIKDIEYSDGSTGPVAIDIANGSVYIEAPGRGYGNSWDLPYYDNDN